MTWRLIEADCIEAMQQMEDSSVDAIVTDPPYGLEFMGKEWDRLQTVAEDPASIGGFQDGNGGNSYSRSRVRYALGAGMQEWHHAWATEALRVLKPGGHLLAFGGTRTYHRLACAIEDAGFEIRDCLAWMYGSGFPKSLDVSKAIDKAAGAEGTYGEPKSEAHAGWIDRGRMRGDEGHEGYQRPWMEDEQAVDRNARKYVPGSSDAEQWQGWGTALKPSHEPVVLARKPLVGTVAANVLEHGTGALNIDGTRIGTDDVLTGSGTPPLQSIGADNHRPFHDTAEPLGVNQHPAGRWPANVLLDEDAAALLDEQTGELKRGANPARRGSDGTRTAFGEFGGQADANPQRGVDVGGASRFFYVSKADRSERERGVEHRTKRALNWSSGTQAPGTFQAEGTERNVGNAHPTVKPVELMQWLCRLVTPPGGVVLDPFTGSGSTGIAALREGFSFIGIEREAEYVEIARDRIIGDAPLFNVSTEVT